MPLSTSNLAFAYHPSRPLLRDLSAKFLPGQLTAVLGPNGSGKSTLLRLLLGALKPQSGEVRLAGRHTHALRGPERAAALAYLPQRPSSWAPVAVRDFVALGRHALPSDPAAIDRALHELDLAPRAADPFAALSAGQQQRASLARVLAQLRGKPSPRAPQTRCLLADEPIAAMDPRHALHAMELLRSLAADGLAVVVVLHDFTLALQYAHSVVLLDDAGCLAASGPTALALDDGALLRVFATRFDRYGPPSAPVLVPRAPASASPPAPSQPDTINSTA